MRQESDEDFDMDEVRKQIEIGQGLLDDLEKATKEVGKIARETKDFEFEEDED